MAGSQSFGKRENEKKKRARRLEKQKRREERQAGGPSSFEEMIAYVDEIGRHGFTSFYSYNDTT